MNDLKKLKTMLDGFGVEYSEERHKAQIEIKCSEGNKKVTGYMMFFTSFYFTHSGDFKEMGAWE